jgi:hypothetical protein
MPSSESEALPVVLVPLERQLLDLARKSGTLPLPELQASLMLLASDALSKFDGSTAPSTSPAQQPSPPLTSHKQQNRVFSLTLSPLESDLAREILKDPYIFRPAPLDEAATERALENALIASRAA